jgi:sugar (glycoside-pentoside-hexuronide) transporter
MYLTSKKERLSYGGWFIGQNIIYMLVTSYLAIFLTDEVGILEGVVATLFLVARIWDAVNDPMLGGIVDKVNPKKGKFKPWIDAVTIFIPLVTIALFWKFNQSGSFTIVYAYIAYIVWGMLYTISDVPIFALATTMTDIPDERVKIMSIGRLAAAIASISVGLVAPQFIANFGYTTTVIILMSISLIMMMPLRFFVKERILYKRSSMVTLKSMFHAIFSNKYLLIFYGGYLAITATLTSMTIAPYFGKWNFGDLATQTTIMATMALPMFLVPILTPWLVKTFGKRKLLIYGLGSSIVLSVLQYFLGYENFLLFLVINGLKSIGLFMPMLMMGIFSADCVEYGAYTTGERNEGVIFSVQTFSTKLGGAIASALSLFVIRAYGYSGIALNQTEQALKGIWITISLIPTIGLVLAFLIFGLFYKLSERDVERMVNEMKEKQLIIEKEV